MLQDMVDPTFLRDMDNMATLPTIKRRRMESIIQGKVQGIISPIVDMGVKWQVLLSTGLDGKQLLWEDLDAAWQSRLEEVYMLTATWTDGHWMEVQSRDAAPVVQGESIGHPHRMVFFGRYGAYMANVQTGCEHSVRRVEITVGLGQERILGPRVLQECHQHEG